MNRLRKWLIKKLGGYTQPPTCLEVKHSYTEPIILKLQIREDPFSKTDKDYRESMLRHEFARRVIEDRLYDEFVEPDFRTPDMIYTYLLRVIPPTKR